MKRLSALLATLLFVSCAQDISVRRPPPETKPAPTARATIARAGTSPLLHPLRTPLADNPGPHEDVIINTEDGLHLRGWIWKAPTGQQRGWVVYVHGINGNRNDGIAAEKTLVPLGFNVLAYDQRAHGESEGTISTWGKHEFDDLHEALEQYTTGQVFLVGEGMGTEPVLREAAIHKRVKGVVLVSTYAELSEPVGELGAGADEVKNFEQQSGTTASDLSPARAAQRIYLPVLFLRGKADPADAKAKQEAFRKSFHKPTEVVEVEGTSAQALSGDEAWNAVANWVQGKVE